MYNQRTQIIRSNYLCTNCFVNNLIVVVTAMQPKDVESCTMKTGSVTKPWLEKADLCPADEKTGDAGYIDVPKQRTNT